MLLEDIHGRVYLPFQRFPGRVGLCGTCIKNVGYQESMDEICFDWKLLELWH